MFPSYLWAAVAVPSSKGNNQKHVLWNGGGRSDAENIVIVIMGDGFTSTQQSAFLTRAASICNVILDDMYPFTVLKDRVNIYAVETHSASSDNGYFEFMKDGDMIKAVSPSVEGQKIGSVLSQHFKSADLMVERRFNVLMVANSTTATGYGYSSNFSIIANAKASLCWAGMGSGNGDAVFVHELGHSLGGLWDERETNGMFPTSENFPNATKDLDVKTSKWRAWVDIDDVGIIKAGSSGWAYPTYWLNSGRTGICLMQGSELDKSGKPIPFCRVCADAIIKTTSGLTGETYKTNNDITTVTVPSGKTRIVDGAFNGCYKLQTVTIPSSVTNIGEYAFLCDTSLKTITNFATTPQAINSKVFHKVGNLSQITLRVPYASVSTYKAANVWKDFFVVGTFDEEIMPPPPSKYLITPSYTSGGKIYVDGLPIASGIAFDVSVGGSKTFTFEPSAGYSVGKVLVNGMNNSAAATAKKYTFTNVTSNETIQVEFVKDGETPLPTYEIKHTYTPATGGRIMFDGIPLASGIPYGILSGGSITLKFDLKFGYSVGEVLINGVSNPTAAAARQHTFSNITGDSTIHVVFAETGDTPISKTEKSNKHFGIRFAQSIVSDEAQMSVILPNKERIVETKVVIYDNIGNVVFEKTQSGADVSWDLTNAAGRFVANGSYLVIAQAKIVNGKVYVYSGRLGVKK
jgi:hypothetical protein